MLTLMCLGLLSLNEPETVLHLYEEIVTTIDGEELWRENRSIFLGQKKVRIDYDQGRLRLIYNLDFHSILVIEMDKGHFYLSRPYTMDERLARLPFTRLATFLDNRLERDGPIFEATGNSRRITGWTCYEYELVALGKIDYKTTIWATDSYILSGGETNYLQTDRRTMRQIWHAALGTQAPSDVRNLINKIFSDLKGVPIQTVTTIETDGVPVTTTVTINNIERVELNDDDFFQMPPNFKIIDTKEPVAERPWPPDQPEVKPDR